MLRLLLTCFAPVIVAGVCFTNSMSEIKECCPKQILTVAEEGEEPEKPYSDEEVEAIAQTISGECYDDQLEDKRLVAEVIVNRVSDGSFGEDVISVVTDKNQFKGYWNPGRPISSSDREVAEEVLQDWHDNNGEALSEYLYFCAGPNHQNEFRAEY